MLKNEILRQNLTGLSKPEDCLDFFIINKILLKRHTYT